MDSALDTYRYALIDFLKLRYGLNGSIQSDIPCLSFNIETAPTEFKSIMYEPCLCIIIQGSKAVGFGNQMYKYDPYKYLLASTHIPSDIKILEASKELPYLSLTIKFTLEDIYEVLKNTHPEKLKFEYKSEKGLFFDTLHVRLYDPILRLVKLLDTPKEDIEFLSPLIIKEILYILVNDKSGYFINKFAMEGTTSNKIVKAITEIKNNFSEKLNIKKLAKLTEMSESSLYQNFKTITSLSPIQFQKKLRLEEAKQMLSVRKIDISEVAFLVGYESPSQFSREYSRMFGVPPSEHLKALQERI
ncbi:AraC family transcriptional regulator [Sulfurospirillum arsenophilum]|uniref:AraC family transcriptional regulator n=1 Tax=Sulfurospirillum arsenophilum TaxID=56698 RepID=UPI0005A81B63|nr:AraC family transcriptional regulator [Sulfurospirillum arsenophilum]